MNFKYWKLIIILFILIALFYLNQYIETVYMFDIEEFSKSMGGFSYIVFTLIFVLLTLIGFSTVILVVLAGYLFELKMAYMISVMASCLAGSIAFFIARNFQEKLKFFRFKKDSKINNIIKRVEKESNNKGFRLVLSLRLMFLPYAYTSYACGFIKNLATLTR